MSEKKTNRRDFLFTATYAVGAVGAGAVIWPMIDQMNPDASVKALASTEVDVSTVNPGKTITVLWRGKPVFIRRRTVEEIAEAKKVSLTELPDPEVDFGNARFLAGQKVESFYPIFVGDTIKAVGAITDVYEKTGRTGTMVFVVNQTEYFNQDNVLVATRQASMVHREVESE